MLLATYYLEAKGNKDSQIKIVPTVSTEFPPFQSQYVYKYSGRDVDHYALKHIDVLPTGSPVQKDKVIVSGNKTATIFNVMELVETATKHQQEIIMGTHTDESERNKVVTEQHKRMIHENQMKDIYSEGCNYESEMFSNCIKQHQNLKLCEPYRAKLTTCQHLALREVRFQSTYARTSTTKASTTQSARLAKVAEAIREAPVSTSANLDTGAQSMNALLPAPPADVGSERDASVPMGPDESNKAEYIIRHIAELILERIFGEWQVEGEEKIQEMVPPMMHASDVKGSCGANLPGEEGFPMGPFSGMMPYFKQVGLEKDKHSNKLRPTNGTLNFREMQTAMVKRGKFPIKEKIAPILQMLSPKAMLKNKGGVAEAEAVAVEAVAVVVTEAVVAVVAVVTEAVEAVAVMEAVEAVAVMAVAEAVMEAVGGGGGGGGGGDGGAGGGGGGDGGGGNGDNGGGGGGDGGGGNDEGGGDGGNGGHNGGGNNGGGNNGGGNNGGGNNGGQQWRRQQWRRQQWARMVVATMAATPMVARMVVARMAAARMAAAIMAVATMAATPMVARMAVATRVVATVVAATVVARMVVATMAATPMVARMVAATMAAATMAAAIMAVATMAATPMVARMAVATMAVATMAATPMVASNGGGNKGGGNSGGGNSGGQNGGGNNGGDTNGGQNGGGNSGGGNNGGQNGGKQRRPEWRWQQWRQWR